MHTSFNFSIALIELEKKGHLHMDGLDAVRTYFSAWNQRDADAILASLTDDGTYEDPGTGGPISGADLKSYVEGLWAAFPDLHFEERSLGSTGPDRAVAEWVMLGTNTGSFRGLPPTQKSVRAEGSDFFTLRDGKVATVKGYFNGGDVPSQLGLDIIVQPSQIGPFKFGISTEVQTGRLDEPVAFSITTLHARDADSVQKVRDGSRASLIDMLKMDGFIGATTAVIGNRMVTISAWDSPEAPRRVMKEGAHAEVQKGMYDGSLATHGFTSVWTKERMNPVMVGCESCGKMTRDPDETRQCKSCGSTLPDAVPFW